MEWHKWTPFNFGKGRAALFILQQSCISREESIWRAALTNNQKAPRKCVQIEINNCIANKCKPLVCGFRFCCIFRINNARWVLSWRCHMHRFAWAYCLLLSGDTLLTLPLSLSHHHHRNLLASFNFLSLCCRLPSIQMPQLYNSFDGLNCCIFHCFRCLYFLVLVRRHGVD